MTQKDLENLACELSLINVFRGIRKLKPMSELFRFLKSDSGLPERMDAFGEFVMSLSGHDMSLSGFLKKAVLEDENAYIAGRAHNRTLPEALIKNAESELELFSRLTRLDAKELCEAAGYGGKVPEFENEATDFGSLISERMKDIGKYGYGIFSSSGMFRVSDGEIIPVEAADDISPDDFIGYEAERKKVFDNTRALIEGKSAANILLYGDAGTGKSSTVKACANFFYSEGVRLIELRKDQLMSLSPVMGRIADNPLKFIIFIDDLSFNRDDDNFSMLKAALEGSASAKAKNAVIYATSNRRHIIKESFSDRDSSDDVHRTDTVQELMSLSDRFGLKVYFRRPDKALYLHIVKTLADKAGIEMDEGELTRRAEAFALDRGSRSPRAAEQFVGTLAR